MFFNPTIIWGGGGRGVINTPPRFNSTITFGPLAYFQTIFFTQTFYGPNKFFDQEPRIFLIFFFDNKNHLTNFFYEELFLTKYCLMNQFFWTKIFSA